MTKEERKLARKVWNRRYSLKNSDKIKEYSKKYREENRDKIKERNRYMPEKYEKHKERILKSNKEWREKNIEHLRKYRRLYKTKRWREDENFRMKESIRHRIYIALSGIRKEKKTEELIGCTFSFLKEYLKERFQEEMTWENYNFYGWHVDHIIPCSTFDLRNEEEQKKCFHYTNLQPLWCGDNLRKSNKINE